MSSPTMTSVDVSRSATQAAAARTVTRLAGLVACGLALLTLTTGCEAARSSGVVARPVYAATSSPVVPHADRNVDVVVHAADRREPGAPLGSYRNGGDGMQTITHSNLSVDFSGLGEGVATALRERGYRVTAPVVFESAEETWPAAVIGGTANASAPVAPVVATSSTTPPHREVRVSLRQAEIVLTDFTPMGGNCAAEYKAAITFTVLRDGRAVCTRKLDGRQSGEPIHAMRDLRDRADTAKDGLHVEFYEAGEDAQVSADLGKLMSTLIDKALSNSEIALALSDLPL